MQPSPIFETRRKNLAAQAAIPQHKYLIESVVGFEPDGETWLSNVLDGTWLISRDDARRVEQLLELEPGVLSVLERAVTPKCEMTRLRVALSDIVALVNATGRQVVAVSRPS
jgi:hypothetical protein